MEGGDHAEITVEDLEAAALEDRFDAVEDAVSDHLSGRNANVAVVSKPIAGRGVLLDYVAEFLGPAAERVSLESVVTDGLPELPNVEVVLVDDCHYLYTRRIGGFEALDRFLDVVATTDTLFVTSWNRYAWNYLAAVRDVDRDFPVEISIPALDSTGVADLLTSHYGPDLPAFVEDDDGGRVRTLGFEEVPVPVGRERTVTLPRPELNLEYVTSRGLSEGEDDTRAVVFEKIANLSAGDPGVALALWERSVRDGEIAPSYVTEVDRTLDLDDEAAFALEVVLSKERVSRDALSAVVRGTSIDRVLGVLAQQGVVTVTDGTVSVVPERLHSIVAHLERRQLVW